MRTRNDNPATIDYAETGETRTGDTGRINGDTVGPGGPEPTILVELVVVDGTEGQELHAIQAEVIRRILGRLAERQVHTPQKARRL